MPRGNKAPKYKNNDNYSLNTDFANSCKSAMKPINTRARGHFGEKQHNILCMKIGEIMHKCIKGKGVNNIED